jgi:hypothetical protein
VERFESLAANVPYEAKGIIFSEMLFLWAAARDSQPSRVLESGRARGQSTHLLALCFDECPVISIERDADSPDAEVATRRLQGIDNVDLRYGDSRQLLPEILEYGDVTFIDGPKGRKSLDLAFTLLGTGCLSMVFVHDCYQGSPERRFLEREVPQAFFSDHDEFVTRFRFLDERIWNSAEGVGAEGWRPFLFQDVEQQSYSATMACLPHVATTDYKKLLARLNRSAFFGRVVRSVRKRLK